MKPRFLAILSLSFLFVLASACQPKPACNDPLGCWVFAPADEIWLAYDQPLAEPDLQTGKDIRAGLEIFIGSHPDYQKHPLKVFEQTMNCFPGQVERPINYLTGSPNLVALVGPACRLDAALSLRLLNDAGLAVLSPLPLLVEGDYPIWLPLAPSGRYALRTTVELLKQFFGGEETGWIVENTPANRFLQQSLCAQLTLSGTTCLEPVLVDVGVSDLKPYLSEPILAEASSWVFLYPAATFANLENLATQMAGKSSLLLDLDSPMDINPSAPVREYWRIGQSSQSIPNGFTLQYQKRYNGENIEIAYKSYQAAQVIIQAITDTANSSRDKSLLLPRQAYYSRLAESTPAPPEICITRIVNNTLQSRDQKCQ